jgi:hypothetical protein
MTGALLSEPFGQLGILHPLAPPGMRPGLAKALVKSQGRRTLSIL